MSEHRVTINRDECIGCGMCERDCPAYNIAIADKKAAVKSQNCIMCGHCVAVCPKAAVSISGFENEPLQIEKPTVLDPQQLLDAIRSRRSLRRYKETPVPQEVIEQIIEAGRWTPSGKNAQDVSYIVLRDEIAQIEQIAVRFIQRLVPLVKLVSKLARNAHIDEHFFFKTAPVAILIVSPNSINASLAASNMELMAEAHGLGVLYSGYFATVAKHSAALRRALHLKGEKVVTALVVGYPNVKYHRTAQKDSAKVRYL